MQPIKKHKELPMRKASFSDVELAQKAADASVKYKRFWPSNLSVNVEILLRRRALNLEASTQQPPPFSLSCINGLSFWWFGAAL